MGTFSQIAKSVPPVITPLNVKKGEDFFGVQAKLNFGKSNDKYEAEADRMADKVVSNKQNNASTSFFSAAPIVQKNQGTEVTKENQTENEVQQKPLAGGINPLQLQSIQKCDCEKETKDNNIQKKPLAAAITPVQQLQPIQKCDCDNENVQKKEEDRIQTETTANADFENKLNSTKGGGAALSEETKAEMESGFDTDFSNVRIHNDTTAIQMNQEIGAQAFASGNDIYFNDGKYNPESTSGKHLLAHELTHTVQQTGTIQRKMGDGHDLKSPRFSGEPKLESAFDDESYIQIGSQGQQVSKIQQALEDSGNPLPKYGVDGIFGPETQGAIRNYQKTNHLLVDGIVGPETMGSLDEYFSKPKPKIPTVHPHVCEILQDDTESPTSQKTLFPLNTLSPDLKKAADGVPTVELPNGEAAIKCKIPPKEKKCTELCGCPLPSEATGPEIKVGDVCKPKKHSVFAGETCPDEKDVLKVIEIQDNSGKFKLKSTSSENDWLKVKICEGPHKGQIKQIQQRFVEQVQNFSLNITGPKTVEKSKSIKLKANGLPTTLTPKWEIKQTDKGEAKITGSDSIPEIEVEGKTESSKKEDIIVSVTACNDSTTHKLTVDPAVPVVPKFIPPGGTCTPSPIDIMRIPGVLRAKGMNEAATLMENWFIGAPAIAPSYGKSDSSTITKTFLNGFSKYTDKIDEILKDKTYMNDAAKDEIRKVLAKRGLNKPGSVFDMSLNPVTFDSKGFSVQSGVIESAGIADPITGLSTALGAFTVKLGIEGKVVQHIVSTVPLVTKDVVIIDKVGFYIRDSYDFNDGFFPQPLGFWNVCTNDIGKTPWDGRERVMNKDFRDWRGLNSKGEDALVFSNDWDIRTLSSSEHFDL